LPGAWRLRSDAALGGVDNMRLDAMLLEQAAQRGRCTLRLYEWRGPWLSLGYGQPASPERLALCEAAAVGVVRRMTGGGAVLHGCDLTYSVAAPEDALPEGLAGSYRWIGAILVEALGSLGLQVSRSAGAERSRREFDCFAAPAVDEICVAGRKLVGSAQRRSGGALLQHGSIRLRPDPATARVASGLAALGTGTSLSEEGANVDARQLREALISAFEARLGQPLREAIPTGR